MDPARSRDVLVTATQADLAQLAGSSRESASRFLAVLERAGVISQGRGRLVVHDPEALKHMSSEKGAARAGAPSAAVEAGLRQPLQRSPLAASSCATSRSS